ncbi:MAG: hypothetical protein HYW88_00940 [Candidatus Sungbacteria bacterium]|nr:hypothetical protein [Candidatus Sungbacteria bacterium]
MKEFMGTYLGFSPTDESDAGYGEVEITIGEEMLTSRMATGLEIQEESFPLSMFEKMTPEEASLIWSGGAPDDFKNRTVGFKSKEDLKLYFMRDPVEGELGLMIQGAMSDLLGPTFLLAPKQIALGLFEKALLKIEEDCKMPGAIPRLHNNGKAERPS